MTEFPLLAVVVPVYNESATIEGALREIVATVAVDPGRPLVIAVDDGSEDGSRAIVDRLSREIDGLCLERHDRNRGYGQACRTGATRARVEGCEYAAFIDADLTNPPADLLVMSTLAREGHPYIKASRFVAGGSMASVPARRRVVSVAGNLVGAALFGAGIRDVTNGFRAVRLDLLERWPLWETDFSCIVEELACALRDGVRPVEFPSVLTARAADQRRSAFPYSGRLIFKYLAYALSARVPSAASLGRRL